MKKSLTRKLTIAVIALVFAVVSLSTSTYAWFTMSNTAQINAFGAEVKAGEGIEIAVTATNDNTGAQWYTGNVPAEVVEAAFKQNGFKQFDALTCVSNKFVDYAAVEDDGSGYVSFYVHIKTATNGTVNLTQIKFDSESVTEWTVDAAFNRLAEGNQPDTNVGDKLTYEVEDSARVQFIGIGTDKGTTATFEKNGDNTETFAGTSRVLGALSYYNSKNPDAKITKNPEGIANYDAYNSTPLAGTAFDDETLNVNSTVLGVTSEGNKIITFQVKIWIEGWDSECLNAIFSQVLKTKFKFALATANNGQQG